MSLAPSDNKTDSRCQLSFAVYSPQASYKSLLASFPEKQDRPQWRATITMTLNFF